MNKSININNEFHKILCKACNTRYKINNSMLHKNNIKFRCNKCGNLFYVTIKKNNKKKRKMSEIFYKIINGFDYPIKKTQKERNKMEDWRNILIKLLCYSFTLLSLLTSIYSDTIIQNNNNFILLPFKTLLGYDNEDIDLETIIGKTINVKENDIEKKNKLYFYS